MHLWLLDTLWPKIEKTLIIIDLLNCARFEYQAMFYSFFSQLPGEISAKVETKGAVTFTNPLSVSLTAASITVDGASVMSADTYAVP